MVAYRSYSDDNRGQLLPGYTGADLMAAGQPFENLTVKLPGGIVLAPDDAQSYVWRLAPYADDDWQTFYTDTNDEGVMAGLEADYSNGIYGPDTGNGSIRGGISERPSFGLNSIFVGGESVHGGSYATNRHPWTGDPNVVPLAVTRFTQVKNPTRLVVFGATAKADNPPTDLVYDDQLLGFSEFHPPFLDESSGDWTNPQWMVGASGVIGGVVTDNDGTGLPIDRRDGGLIPVAHLDGSTEAVKVTTLSADMRKWNARGVGPLGLTPGN